MLVLPSDTRGFSHMVAASRDLPLKPASPSPSSSFPASSSVHASGSGCWHGAPHNTAMGGLPQNKMRASSHYVAVVVSAFANTAAALVM